MLPPNPPVRGRSRIRKRKTVRPDKENLYESVMRKRKRTEEASRKNSRVKKVLGNSNTSNTELEILRGGQMLTDVHMNAANNLMRKQFSHIEGFQDTLLGSNLQFDVCCGKFCQILHNGNDHWLCASNIFCDNISDVIMYDSLPCSCSSSIQCSCGPNMHVKMQVASILMLNRPHMDLIFPSFQRQVGGVDCGLFAIAACTSLCFGNNPSDCHYDQSKMRSHFELCLSSGKLNEFPYTVKGSNKKKFKRVSVPLYCSCRLPDNNAEKMAECSSCREWLHKTCMQIPPDVFEDESSRWKCERCQQIK